MKRIIEYSLLLLMLCLSSCIEPPLKLPAEEVLVDMPIVGTVGKY